MFRAWQLNFPPNGFTLVMLAWVLDTRWTNVVSYKPSPTAKSEL